MEITEQRDVTATPPAASDHQQEHFAGVAGGLLAPYPRIEGDALLVQLDVLGGIYALLLVLALVCLVVRYRKGATVIFTRRDGYLVPGTGLLFPAFFAGFFIAAQVLIWRTRLVAKDVSAYPGLVPAHVAAWGLLASAIYIEVHGLLVAANFNPRLLALPLPRLSFRPFPQCRFKLWGCSSHDAHPGNNTSSRPLLRPRTFNALFAGFFPLTGLTLLILCGVFATTQCERAFRGFAKEHDTMLLGAAEAGGPDRSVEMCVGWSQGFYTVCIAILAFNLVARGASFIVLFRHLRAQIAVLQATIMDGTAIPEVPVPEKLSRKERAHSWTSNSTPSQDLPSQDLPPSAFSAAMSESHWSSVTAPSAAVTKDEPKYRWMFVSVSGKDVPDGQPGVQGRFVHQCPLVRLATMKSARRTLVLQTTACSIGCLVYLPVFCLLLTGRSFGQSSEQWKTALLLWYLWALPPLALPMLSVLLWTSVRAAECGLGPVSFLGTKTQSPSAVRRAATEDEEEEAEHVWRYDRPRVRELRAVDTNSSGSVVPRFSEGVDMLPSPVRSAPYSPQHTTRPFSWTRESSPGAQA